MEKGCLFLESEMTKQMLEDLKKTLADLLNHEREIRDSL